MVWFFLSSNNGTVGFLCAEMSNIKLSNSFCSWWTCWVWCTIVANKMWTSLDNFFSWRMTLHASFGCNSGNFVRCRVLRTLRRSDIFLGREQNFFHTQRLRTSRTHEFSGVSTYSTYEPVPVRSVRNAHPRLQREKKANCKILYWYVP